ncbi:MAG: hypothetical protein J7502_13730, partial [Flavisolibacter sp.]|nr:hypothetical protein [Flavisolibacter sp.]
MKRLLIPATTILFCSLGLSAFSQDVTQAKNQTSGQPYKVQYTNISIGNPAYVQKVLWAWKYYDDNTLDKAADFFADDIVATFPDGTMIKG